MPTIKTTGNTDVDVEIDVEVFCATCGAGLCNKSTAGKTRNRQVDCIEVEACAKCMGNAEDKGYEKARAEFENK